MHPKLIVTKGQPLYSVHQFCNSEFEKRHSGITFHCSVISVSKNSLNNLKRCSLAYATIWMDLEVMNSKSERERQIPDGFSHLWNTNNQSKCTNKILTKLSQRLGEKNGIFQRGRGRKVEERVKAVSLWWYVLCVMAPEFG